MFKAKNSQKHLVNRFIQLAAGLLLAVLIFHATKQYNTMDCQSIHLTVHGGGLPTLARIGLVIFVFTLCGLPLILSAAAAGFLTAPFMGAALTSLSMVLALAFVFGIYRMLGRDHSLVRSLESFSSKTPWFERMQASQSSSGLSWTLAQVQETPLPVSWFAGYCGALVSHLTLPSFIAGAFLSTSVVIISYSFLGAYVGCAVVDYQFGLPIDRYRFPILLSCVLVLLMTRLKPRFVT